MDTASASSVRQAAPEAAPMKNDLVTAPAPVVVGWKEYVDLVDWGICHVKAKIDTGARTSALDVASYELRETAAGLIAELRLHLHPRRPERATVIEVPVLRLVAVRSSSGMSEQRPLVEATIRLGAVVKRIGLTLTNRAGMRFRLILGRKALEGDFLVDVGRKYLCGRSRKSEPGG
jgi:hypothetical protein